MLLELDQTIYKYLIRNKSDYVYNYLYDILSTRTISEVIYFFFMNPFFNDKQKMLYTHELCQTKKILFTLSRFKKKLMDIYLIKTCNITDSLCCIQLNTIQDSNKFCLIENKTKYVFYINDLHTIMHKSLTLSDNLFNKPTLPNNPYTNTPISIANLYNFYFFCKHNNKPIPELFYRFYTSNFCITKFMYNNEYYLRDIVISSYYTNIKTIEKYYDIISILRKYKKHIKKIKIHPDFNKNTIVDIFESILTFDLFIEYSFNHNKKVYYKNKLIKYLKHINTNNPMIGQLQYQNFSRFKVKKNIQFKDDYKNNPEYYKADILSYKYKHIPNVQNIINFIMEHLNRHTISENNTHYSTIQYTFTSPTISYDDSTNHHITTFNELDFIL